MLYLSYQKRYSASKESADEKFRGNIRPQQYRSVHSAGHKAVGPKPHDNAKQSQSNR